MKLLLLPVLWFFCLSLHSQVKLSGQVIDKETKQPIPFVLISDKDGKVLCQTDQDGRYSLEVFSPGWVHFSHLAYNPDSIPANATDTCRQVVLAPHTIGLGEVIVSPDYVNQLLSVAYVNLIKRLDTERSRPYLCHSKENTTIGGEQEAYALIDVKLKEINKKKANWEVNLLSIDKLKQVNQESFYIKKKPFRMAFLPTGLNSESDLSHYICEREEVRGDLLTIRISPKHPDKHHYYYTCYIVNLTDTVVVECIMQSFPQVAELTQHKYRGVDFSFLSAFSKVLFKQEPADSTYFVSELQYLDIVQIGRGASAYQISFGSSLELWKGGKVENQGKKKKIKPYSYALFECEFENTPGFWKFADN